MVVGIGEKHISLAPVISQVGVELIVTVFEHCDGTPFNVVIKLMVKVPPPAPVPMFTVCPVFIPIIPPLPVTVQEQQTIITKQQKIIDELLKRVEALEKK